MCVGNKEESRSYTTAFLLKWHRNVPMAEERQVEYLEEGRGK